MCLDVKPTGYDWRAALTAHNICLLRLHEFLVRLSLVGCANLLLSKRRRMEHDLVSIER
jgi:hypothetical protein